MKRKFTVGLCALGTIGLTGCLEGENELSTLSSLDKENQTTVAPEVEIEKEVEDIPMSPMTPAIETGPIYTMTPAIETGPIYTMTPAIETGPIYTMTPAIETGPIYTMTPATEIIVEKTPEIVAKLEAIIADDQTFDYQYDDSTEDVIINGLKEGVVIGETLEVGKVFNVDGYKFYTKSIADRAFSANYREGLDNVKTVILNEGIESIGSYGFYKTNIKGTLTMPSTMVYIGVMAFKNEVSEDVDTYELILNEGLETIDRWGFEGAAIEGTLVVPSTLKVILYYTFYHNRLDEIIISEGVEDIQKNAFLQHAQTKLVTIHIPNSLTSIGDDAFFSKYPGEELVITYNEGSQRPDKDGFKWDVTFKQI